MRIVYEHDFDCPLGVNGLRAYVEAIDALQSTPPEARETEEDKAALALAEHELNAKQKCNCGLGDAPNVSDGRNATLPRCRHCPERAKFIINGVPLCFDHRNWRLGGLVP